MTGSDTGLSSPSQSEHSQMEHMDSSMMGFSKSYLESASEASSDDDNEGATPRQEAAPEVEAAAKEEEVFEVKELTEADLEEVHSIMLSETETIWLLDIQDLCVSNDSPQHEEISKANRTYKALKSTKVGNDLYVARGMQTFNHAQKVKDVQVAAVTVKESSAAATDWEIYDAYEELRESLKEEGEMDITDTDKEAKAAGDAEDALSDGEENEFAADAGPSVTTTRDSSARAAESILNSASLRASLRLVERVVTQNWFHPEHLKYRDFDVESIPLVTATPALPTLKLLWSFECNVTNGYSCSCVCFNPRNQDLLVAGYAHPEKGGLILCWSLKNPKYPERISRTASSVLSVSFSNVHPNLVAAGLTDGTVSVHDIRPAEGGSSVASGYATGKHTDPVWNVRWVVTGSKSGERLVSISTDGRITEWSIKKGLEFSDLMKLKRIPNPAKLGEGKSEAFISRQAGGLCFDFYPADTNFYVCGTEDGIIHKCSCSYNEQTLENFFGHTGPVYQLRWSPYCSNYFISCSADWTTKLWNQDQTTPLISFHSGAHPVADCAWSPSNSTVFGTVTSDGRVELWDLLSSTLDPVVRLVEDTPQTCMAFATNAAVLVTGNSMGVINVHKIVNMPVPPESVEEQRVILEKAIAQELSSLE